VLDGKARSVSGVTARGNTLTIRLARNAPDLLTRLAMPFFVAMDRQLHPIDAKGVKAPMHGAGPYYIQSWTPNSRLIVVRNPHYRGSRPANVNRIEYEANVNLDAQCCASGRGRLTSRPRVSRRRRTPISRGSSGSTRAATRSARSRPRATWR
jgi:hypothetical protein